MQTTKTLPDHAYRTIKSTLAQYRKQITETLAGTERLLDCIAAGLDNGQRQKLPVLIKKAEELGRKTSQIQKVIKAYENMLPASEGPPDRALRQAAGRLARKYGRLIDLTKQRMAQTRTQILAVRKNRQSASPFHKSRKPALIDLKS